VSALRRRSATLTDIDAAHVETAFGRFAGCHRGERSARRDRAGVGDLVAYDGDVWPDDDFLFAVLVLNGTTDPSTPATVAPTVPLVMVESGAPSQGRCPSPVPRMDSAKMCTSSAFCEPSGCGVAPLPTYNPGLMSATEALTTAATSALSASLSVSSSPLLDFASTARPSSFSIVPRNRIVCGCGDAACCASAALAAPRRLAQRRLPFASVSSQRLN
jgi:hypothetical protein